MPLPCRQGDLKERRKLPSRVGAELRPKTILVLSRRDRMHILDKELDRIVCCRLCAALK